MNNNFYKLSKELKFTLDKVLQIENYNVSISEKDFNRNNIEKLIEMGYLEYVADATSINDWGCFIRPTYNAVHYKELKNQYNKQVISEWIKFWIPVSISIVSLIMSILNQYIVLFNDTK